MGCTPLDDTVHSNRSEASNDWGSPVGCQEMEMTGERSVEPRRAYKRERYRHAENTVNIGCECRVRVTLHETLKSRGDKVRMVLGGLSLYAIRSKTGSILQVLVKRNIYEVREFGLASS